MPSLTGWRLKSSAGISGDIVGNASLITKAFASNILSIRRAIRIFQDTYRTLMAADSAVMVIDAAKALEPQTQAVQRPACCGYP